MLQAATWSFRNASVNMGNQLVVTSSELEKAEPSSKSELNRCNSNPKHVFMILYDYFSVFHLNMMRFLILSPHENSF